MRTVRAKSGIPAQWLGYCLCVTAQGLGKTSGEPVALTRYRGHMLRESRLLLADSDARVCGIYAQGEDSGGRNGVTGDDGTNLGLSCGISGGCLFK
jgi:hypothetical protein